VRRDIPDFNLQRKLSISHRSWATGSDEPT
jgi:hypothetical protein